MPARISAFIRSLNCVMIVLSLMLIWFGVRASLDLPKALDDGGVHTFVAVDRDIKTENHYYKGRKSVRTTYYVVYKSAGGYSFRDRAGGRETMESAISSREKKQRRVLLEPEGNGYFVTVTEDTPQSYLRKQHRFIFLAIDLSALYLFIYAGMQLARILSLRKLARQRPGGMKLCKELLKIVRSYPGNKILAIKKIRDHTGYGLYDAKSTADQLYSVVHVDNLFTALLGLMDLALLVFLILRAAKFL